MTALALRNFRGFRECRVPLAPLTFLVGPNSSGKSSLFSAVMLLAQSEFGPHAWRKLAPEWIGELVDLGSFDDAVYRHESKRTISIEIDMPAKMMSRRKWVEPSSEQVRLRFELRTQRGDTVGRMRNLLVSDLTSGAAVEYTAPPRGAIVTATFGRRRVTYNIRGREDISQHVRRYAEKQPSDRRHDWLRLARFLSSWEYYILSSGMQRVSSGRAAPQRWYPITDIADRGYEPRERLFDSVRPGAFVADSERRYLSRRFSGRKGHKKSLASVLTELNIASSVASSRLSPYHSAVRVRDNVTDVPSNLIDVGFGASQVIPVIEACLQDADGPLFVEEPEIHLHPRAQAVIGQLLSETSRQRQVIVETHSVHMINKARLMIARGELPPSHVTIHYVHKDKRGSRIESIGLKENGDFSREWPEGFFEERYQDTLALMALKKS